MENELRYYLGKIKAAIEEESFEPSYIIVATKLPSEAIELAINTTEFIKKITYMLEAYDEDMHLKANDKVSIVNLMIV